MFSSVIDTSKLFDKKTTDDGKLINLLVAQLNHEIDELKKGFEDTDYKTIKNLQSQALGYGLPYSWEEIHDSAEAIRIKIREKELEIKNLLEVNTEETSAEESTETNSADAK